MQIDYRIFAKSKTFKAFLNIKCKWLKTILLAPNTIARVNRAWFELFALHGGAKIGKLQKWAPARLNGLDYGLDYGHGLESNHLKWY